MHNFKMLLVFDADFNIVWKWVLEKNIHFNKQQLESLRCVYAMYVYI